MRLVRVALCLAVLVGSVAAYGSDVLPPLPPLPGLAGAGAAAAVPSVPSMPLPHVRGGAFDLRFVNVGQLVDLLYGDALHVPHVISSEVLQDTRLVSFQYDGKGAELREFLKVFLDSQGFDVQTKDGVDFVTKKPVEAVKRPDDETFVYRPRYRPASYLAKLVQPFFQGRMNAVTTNPIAASPELGAAVGPTGQGGAAGGAATPWQGGGYGGGLGGSQQSGVSSADELVFVGLASEIRDVKRLLPQLDVAAGEVVVRGWVYEVENTNSKNSAFSIAAHVLGGSLSLANGATDQDATALRFQGGWLDAAISALNADSRFKQVSDPRVRVISGEKVHLNVGSQVPTLGSISYQGAAGTPVQSVDYQSAGLIFDVTPTVMAESIRLSLDEQISSFVATTTGVNNSPTKNTRELSTTVDMQDGEVIVLGGLVQDGDSYARNSPGWLPKFLDGVSSSKDRTEVLLVLQVQKI